MTKKKSDKPRGKPAGTRTKPELYGKIMALLNAERDTGGQGMTAFRLHTTLKVPDPTIRMYVNDLVREGKVKARTVANITVFRPAPVKSVTAKQ